MVPAGVPEGGRDAGAGTAGMAVRQLPGYGVFRAVLSERLHRYDAKKVVLASFFLFDGRACRDFFLYLWPKHTEY